MKTIDRLDALAIAALDMGTSYGKLVASTTVHQRDQIAQQTAERIGCCLRGQQKNTYDVIETEKSGKYALCRDCGAVLPPRYKTCAACKEKHRLERAARENEAARNKRKSKRILSV